MKLRFSGWLGAFLVAATVLVALLSLVWTPYDPTLAHPDVSLAGPSAEHLLGTDRFGRDTASRIMAGAQITVFVGLVAVGIAAVVGVPLGILAGMRRGTWADALVMRGADLLLAFPALLLAIIAGAVWGPSTLTAMVAIGIAGIPSFARVARSGTLQVITQDFISSARISAVPGWKVAWRGLLWARKPKRGAERGARGGAPPRRGVVRAVGPGQVCWVNCAVGFERWSRVPSSGDAGR